MLTELVLASSNPGKKREFERLLLPLGVTVLDQASLGVAPAPEPHMTYVENALAKARHASEMTNKPALADDSGLCVPALGGAPGVRSARYADPVQGMPQDEANNAYLVRSLEGIADRRAMYVALLVMVMRADDPLPIVAQGLWHGEVIDEPRGQHGFGYDPHFWLAQQSQTAAELAPELKNSISHRAIATELLLAEMRKRSLII
ncbi:MAG: RdgB/HAM1 family non-canonical purine NTP pyrophosphatase [Orrella sp.]